MNEFESPFWEEVDDDTFMASIAKPIEATDIIQHVAANVNMHGHLAVIEPHEPMNTHLHDDSEYLKIANATVRRIVRRHRKALNSNLY